LIDYSILNIIISIIACDIKITLRQYIMAWDLIPSIPFVPTFSKHLTLSHDGVGLPPLQFLPRWITGPSSPTIKAIPERKSGVVFIFELGVLFVYL